MKMTSFKPFDTFGSQLQQSIMPLVVIIGDKFKSVGSCFILNSDGLFVTAAHVLTSANDMSVRIKNEDGQYYSHYELYALYISNEPSEGDSNLGGLVPVSNVWALLDIDIGFGFLQLPINTSTNLPLKIYPVRIKSAFPTLRGNITAIGYHNMEGKIDRSAGCYHIDYKHDTAIAAGVVEEIYPVSRDNGLLSFPCFRTNAQFAPGMSGGPIFDDSGNVCGVVCSGTQIEEGGANHTSYGSLIWPIFGCEIDIADSPNANIRKTLLYDLAKKGIISTDASFDQIEVVKNENNTRTVRISSKS
jgi:hypothetical protein